MFLTYECFSLLDMLYQNLHDISIFGGITLLSTTKQLHNELNDHSVVNYYILYSVPLSEFQTLIIMNPLQVIRQHINWTPKTLNC